MKIVERAGDSLEGLLHRSNPWSGVDCARDKCLLCETKQSNPRMENHNCMKRNVVYETWCEKMRKVKEQTVEKRSSCSSTLEKVQEAAMSGDGNTWGTASSSNPWFELSHMLKHILDKHEGEVKFQMQAVKFHRSAFERQVHEAVLIQANRGHNILNSRSEYNRCALPRLGTKLGERETKEKEVEEEERKEQELEERIRNLRKERQRKRRTSKPIKEKETEDRG